MTHQLDVATLPLILCGPMLRRVTSESVSVFVALTHPRDLTLRIHETTDPTTGLMFSGTASTVPLGRYLHVAVITSTKAANDRVLTPGQVYGYDLQLSFPAAAGPAPAVRDSAPDHATFASLGLLAGTMPLGYAAGALPGFALAPTDIDDLNLLHGSCRKPHGGGPDMLTMVDRFLRADRSAVGRPHQLLLTGDQIYADDVSLCLLATLRSNAMTLLGAVPETLLGPGGPLGFDAPPVLPHSGRPKTMEDHTRHTSGEGENHLMFRAEFILMYLMAWSDVLWPRDAAGQLTLPTSAEVIAKGETDAVKLERQKDDEAEEARTKTLKYADGLAAVQRALANVPTAMIFDDHEVTDDWNLNRAWEDASLANALSQRMLRNGLWGYAIFQDWGNRPEVYAPGAPGHALLDAAHVTLTATGGTAPVETTPNMIDKLLAVSPDRDTTGRLHWHYALAGTAHRIIVLDTRTMRDPAPDPENASALLTPAARDMQIAPHLIPTSKVTILVSPAPAIGVAVVEDALQRTLAATLGPAFADDEAWGANRAGFEAFVRQIAGFGTVVILSGDVHYGFSNDVAYFREDIVQSARIVQLCASALKNEDFKTNAIGIAGPVFRSVGRLGFDDTLPPDLTDTLRERMNDYIEALDPSIVQGTLRLALEKEMIAHRAFDAVLRDLLAKPVVLPSNGWDGPQLLAGMQDLVGRGLGPQWRYKISFATDARLIAEREAESAGLMLADDETIPSVGDREFAAMQANDIAGFCNIGQVRFEGSASFVTHKMYWRGLTRAKVPSSGIFTTTHSLPLYLPDPGIDWPEVTQ